MINGPVSKKHFLKKNFLGVTEYLKFKTNKNYFIKDEGSKKLFIKDTNNVITDLERQFSNGKLSLEKYESMLSKVDEWKIVIVDKEGKLKHTFDSQGREVIPVSRETDLLDKFVSMMEEVQPDILVGYTSDYFDIPYLYYRIKNTMGKRTASRMSPINIIEERHWSEDMPIRIAGVASLDYIRLHKKYSFKDEPSYKLDSLGEKYVDQKKIEYEGSLDRLFEEDKEKFNAEANKVFNKYRKSITGVAAGEKEIEFLNKSIPKTISQLNAMRKLLEEE